ncbi:LOW QUALITY PROTEIN: hypothetical protein TorRG33x02_219290 [Trema orientale]|uniref:Uncharacterized protein n=1 Tax=Trema orientale TaxID=63057 RepID=A0A2P5E9U4_TREOI|nr:LOW QUALITY PROTEIN: hypothetical protein TorRG33x02_219290 [Trema orientale]
MQTSILRWSCGEGWATLLWWSCFGPSQRSIEKQRMQKRIEETIEFTWNREAESSLARLSSLSPSTR